MEWNDICQILKANPYPGRGIIAGKSICGEYAVCAYFIMGRSENSRNRVFVPTEDGIRTEAHDPAKMTDPSLIIYHPVRVYEDKLIVTNGDQTDTIWEYVKQGKTFDEALMTRCFEPDAPNFTPRISAELDQENGYRYQMSILKAADEEGKGCNRFTYRYEPANGTGHFIHTYAQDGNPLPSFVGEPVPVRLNKNLWDFADALWESLNEDNKVSLYVCFRNLKDGTCHTKILNKHQ